MSLPEDCEACANCGCEPCKCNPNGPDVYSPSNSDDILDPVPSDELAPDDESEDEGTGNGSTETETEEEMSCYGPLAADFTAPAIGANGTITITGASNFAAAGGYLWIPGLGYLLVNSAGGDTLAVTNQDITGGTVINTGTKAFFAVPPTGPLFAAGLASLCVGPACGCAEDPEEVECIDSMIACVDGTPQGVLTSNLRQLLTPLWHLPGGSALTIADLDSSGATEGDRTYSGFTAPDGATHMLVLAECAVDDDPAGNISILVGGREYIKINGSWGESYATVLAFAPIEADPTRIEWSIGRADGAGSFGGVGSGGFVRLRGIGYAAMNVL